MAVVFSTQDYSSHQVSPKTEVAERHALGVLPWMAPCATPDDKAVTDSIPRVTHIYSELPKVSWLRGQ